MALTDWTLSVAEAWSSVWQRFVAFLPNLIGAAIILIVGWLAGMIVAMVLDRVFRLVGLQTLFEKAKIEDTLKKANVEQDGSYLLASIAKWIIYLVSFIAAANVLKLTEVADFFDRILAYIPAVIASIAILLIGLVLANFLSRVVKAGVSASGLHAADSLALITRYAIIVFTILAVLVQLGIAEALITTLFTGVIAFLVIAGGLAFGLGGRDAAQDWIEKIRKELK